MMILMGIAGVIVINSIFVVMNRKKEYSYYFLILLAAVRIFCMLIDTSSLPLSMNNYYHLHHIIVVLPAVLNTAVGVWLLSDHSKKYNYRFALVTVFLMALVLFLQYSFEYNWYHLIQLIGALIFFGTCFQSASKGMRGWPILCVGYSICYAIVAFIYSINIWNAAIAGAMIICLNATSISYIPSLMSCMIYISVHLTDKYNEAEELTIQLSEMNSELDLKVLERTEELVASQNRQKKMMMNIFHDLRNPVFILKGYVEKLKNEETGLKEMMMFRLEHLQRLIDDLFLSEKLEGHEVSVFKDMIQLDELIKEVVEGIQLSSGRVINLDVQPVMVWADETRIIQIIENLLDNAIRYTSHQDDICIRVLADQQKAVIEVKDSGPGFSKEDSEHIFERYYTCKGKEKKSGTGLGLYITKMLAELHGGQIKVVSEIGKGTCFQVELPFDKEGETR